MEERRNFNGARAIAYIALFSAMLTGGKLALSALPNVEIVTLLILVYATVFGATYAVPATLVFCTVEMLIYGTGNWVVLYFLYWPLLALVASLFCKRGKLWVALVIALCFTLFFGVLSSLIDAVLFSFSQNTASRFFEMFALYYARGIVFYISQFLSNLAFVLLLYRPLCKVLKTIDKRGL